jgi:hypothetical protein
MYEMKELLLDYKSRINLVEIGQADLIKKYRILEDYSHGMISSGDNNQRGLDSLYIKMQELEAQFMEMREVQGLQNMGNT